MKRQAILLALALFRHNQVAMLLSVDQNAFTPGIPGEDKLLTLSLDLSRSARVTLEGEADTRAFLSRRIENVMGIEKAKAAFRANPLGRALLGGPFSALSKIRAPRANNLPGSLEP